MADAPKKRAPLIARLLLALAPIVIGLGAAELILRRYVPFCGVTPFRPSALKDLSHELRPNFETLYKGFDVRINSLGFRGAEWPAREPGSKRVVFLGDSVTFGNAIDEPDTFPRLLDEHWQRDGVKAHALNAGVPGYNAGNVATVLENRIAELAPDLVVYVFVFNDIEVNPMTGNIPQDSRIDTLSEYPMRSATMQWLGMHARVLARAWFGDTASGWVGQVLKALETGGRDRLRAALIRMQRACEQAHVPMVVAIYPHATKLDMNPFRTIDEAAKLICAEFNVPVIDLADAFDKGEDLGRYWASPFDSHPNRVANEKVATFLARILRERL